MEGTKEILSKKDLKELETVMNLKYGLSRKDRKFHLELREEGQNLYVTSILKNEDESFYYPVESVAKIKKNSEIILVCGAGGQAALTGKTLVDMGYTNVSNVGAIGDWEKNRGPMTKS